MPSSRGSGCSHFTQPGLLRDTPDGKLPTVNLSAGKPLARFGGRGGASLPYPYRLHGRRDLGASMQSGFRQSLPE